MRSLDASGRAPGAASTLSLQPVPGRAVLTVMSISTRCRGATGGVTAHGNNSYKLTEHIEENNRPSMHACKKNERLNPASLDPISSHYLSEISLLLARLLTCIMTTYVIKGAAG